MGLPSRSTFDRRIATLDLEEFTSFVADLWARRGVEVRTQEPGRVRLQTGEDLDRHVRVVTRPCRFGLARILSTGRTTAEIDLVVTNRANPCVGSLVERVGIELVGPEQLFELLRYAVDSSASDALVRKYLRHRNRSETVLDVDGIYRDHAKDVSVSLPRRETVLPTWIRRGPDRSSALSVIACLAILVVGLTLVPTVDEGGRSPASLQWGEATSAGAKLASGNESALLDRHEWIVRNGSFRLQVTYRGTSGSVLTTRRWQRSRQFFVVDPDTWHYRITGALSPATIGQEPRRVHVLLEGDASSCQANIHPNASEFPDDPCSSVPDGDLRGTVTRLSRHAIQRYIGRVGPEMRRHVERPDGKYEIIAHAPPAEFSGEVTNYTAREIVADDGLIRRLTVKYRSALDSTNRWTRFSYTFYDVSRNEARSEGGDNV